MKDKRILFEKFIECAICGDMVRESEITVQRGLNLCPRDVDVLDHEGENN